jgi:hypothetical protein
MKGRGLRMIKSRKLSKKDFNDKGLKSLINRDLSEINHLSDQDIISLWSFFKYLLIEDQEDLVFMTEKDSIIYKNKEALEKHNVRIKNVEEMLK